MAVEIGTATNYKALLLKLKTFLTGAALGTQAWTALRYTTGAAGAADELILRAPGNGGTDQIFSGITTFENVTADYYNWRIAGFSGFDAALTFGAEPGVMKDVFVPLWNSPISYWFIANGRRCIMIAKVSTVYCMMYLGFINQYASPSQFPYPLFVGGAQSHGAEPSLTDPLWRWSNPGNQNHNFPMGNLNGNFSQARLRTNNGVWKNLYASTSLNQGNYIDAADSGIWPYQSGMSNIQQNLGAAAQSVVIPIILSGSEPEIYGEFDGIAATSGQGIASEDILTVGGDSWLVVQDVFRTTRDRYCCVRLV